VTHFRRSPRPVALALEEVQVELAPDTMLAEAQAAWRASVGDAIAEQARPISERGGVLTIACSASVWAQELDLMAPAIIERLNGAVGGSRGRAQITRIRCVTTPH
jgi:predicted nucleic acid-binding Zn ribbon protein